MTACYSALTDFDIKRRDWIAEHFPELATVLDVNDPRLRFEIAVGVRPWRYTVRIGQKIVWRRVGEPVGVVV